MRETQFGVLSSSPSPSSSNWVTVAVGFQLCIKTYLMLPFFFLVFPNICVVSIFFARFWLLSEAEEKPISDSRACYMLECKCVYVCVLIAISLMEVLGYFVVSFHCFNFACCLLCCYSDVTLCCGNHSVCFLLNNSTIEQNVLFIDAQ